VLANYRLARHGIAMFTKDEIVTNWMPRYTGLAADQVGKFVLLTNFNDYVHRFAKTLGVPVVGEDRPMMCATAGPITMINFGMGSANAATVMDLLSAVRPEAVLFLGKCGGLKKRNKLGDIVLPIAAIRGEGTSNDYFPPEIPALPAFALQKAISRTIREYEVDYWTGTVYTTNRRVWEHDLKFKEYLERNRIMAIDMETATLFSVGFFNHIPTGALLLVSDQPMVPEGIKTTQSDTQVSQKFVESHLRIGIDSLRQLINHSDTLRHLRF
jgi:AMP nucleosidase